RWRGERAHFCRTVFGWGEGNGSVARATRHSGDNYRRRRADPTSPRPTRGKLESWRSAHRGKTGIGSPKDSKTLRESQLLGSQRAISHRGDRRNQSGPRLLPNLRGTTPG